MKLYLSGAIRGEPDDNLPLFRANEKALTGAGHTVLSPTEPLPWGDNTPGRDEFMRYDIQIIGIVDAVAVLPGWELSPGARFEVAQAWQIDIPVYEAESLVRGVPKLITQTSVSIPRETQYYRNYPLIGLSGFAGAGKDEVAQVLVQHGWTRVAFADPVKYIARDLGWNGEKDEKGRIFLQDLGYAVREHLNVGAWLLRGEERIENANGPCVVTDVRFANEIHMVKRRGGIMIRVHRPGLKAVNNHVSEHGVTEDDCDFVFHNDGELDDLPGKVRSFFSQKLGIDLSEKELLPL